jgi:hypothetical protein
MTSTTTTHMRDGPALTAAGLGLLSGIISAAFCSTFEPDWLKPIGNLFLLDVGAVPIGAVSGVVIGMAVAMERKRPWAAPLLVMTTMIAWSAAIHTATVIYNGNGSEPIAADGVRLFCAGVAAGAVGACITHLGVALVDSRLRRLPRFALTTLVGALSGVVFFLGEKNVVYPGALYIIWQPAVAFCIGLGMGRAAGKV